MKKTLSSCAECGEDKSILTQVSCTMEVLYLCSDCYNNKYSKERNLRRGQKSWQNLRTLKKIKLNLKDKLARK